MAYLKLSPEQLAALRDLAAQNPALAAVLPARKARGGGIERQFAEAVFRTPDISVEALMAQFPSLKEPRVKYLRRLAQNYVAIAKATGRWAEAAEAPKSSEGPKLEQPRPVKKAA